MDNNGTKSRNVLLELDVNDDGFSFLSSIESALSEAEMERGVNEEKISENLITLKSLTPECDKTDYILSVCSGAICALIDIFLVGKPGESPAGDVTDRWFEDRTKDFAKLCGWNDKNNSQLSSAIRFLEKKFEVPYDQRGAGDAASWVFDLTPSNHHFKSLGHNPTILGLFFSILDQFMNTSHFVTDGKLIALQQADDGFVLRGSNVPTKLFCGIANWFGHLVSDMSGSSGGKGRGMGIPSPLWSWANDVIAIKKAMNINDSEFGKSFNELALTIYKEGYDVRFQAAQIIPVFINEMTVRLLYSFRRLIRYFVATNKESRSFTLLWKNCEPFSNATVKRMLTVAHGTFCLIDTGDAVVHGFFEGGGTFNIAEFFMRLNIVGIGRFTISVYGEVNRGFKRTSLKEEVAYLDRKKIIIDDYISGLQSLADMYDDKELLTFVDDLKTSNLYITAFNKTVKLAEKRKVPEEKILKNKRDIDCYFKGGNV